MAQQARQRAASDQAPGHPAEDQLADAGMAIAAGHDQVRLFPFRKGAQPRLDGGAAAVDGLAADRDAMGGEKRLGVSERARFAALADLDEVDRLGTLQERHRVADRTPRLARALPGN